MIMFSKIEHVKYLELVLKVICKIRVYYKTYFETNLDIFNFFVTEYLHFRRYVQLKNRDSVLQQEYRNLYIRIIRMEGSRQ
jgi:general stress protein CsbA